MRAARESLLERAGRAPLLHFLIIGASLLFLTSRFGGKRDPASYRIVVSAGQVESLIATFMKSWQRPPTPEELRGLVDEQIRQEIYFREAVARGLDQNDLVVRRRLRQKMEFVAADTSGNQSSAEAQKALYERLRARYVVVIASARDLTSASSP
jgi:hypothetical protein